MTVPQAEHPTGKPVPRPLGVLFWLSHLQLRPPQHRADARQKLTRTEGLSEIIVGAELKSNDAVNLIEMLTGKHDDWQIGFGTGGADNLQAVLVSQFQINDL